LINMKESFYFLQLLVLCSPPKPKLRTYLRSKKRPCIYSLLRYKWNMTPCSDFIIRNRSIKWILEELRTRIKQESPTFVHEKTKFRIALSFGLPTVSRFFYSPSLERRRMNRGQL
jgi:hypothetical protein